MLQENAKYFRWLYMLMDYLMVCLAFFISFKLQKLAVGTDLIPVISFPFRAKPYEMNIYYVLIGAMYWVVNIRSYGGYRSIRRLSYYELAWVVLRSVLLATLVFGTITFIINPETLTQVVIILIFVNTLILLIIEKFFLLFFLHSIRERGYNYQQFLIVGTGKRARNLAHALEANRGWGLKVVGFVDDSQKVGMDIDGKKVIGSLDELESILDNNVVDEVVFCMPRKWMDKLEKYITICEKVGVKVDLALDFFNTIIAKPRFTELAGTPLLSLESAPSRKGELFVKRAIDLVASLVLLLLLSPLFLLISLIIKLTSPGPAIFNQERTGKNGRIFTLYKFRTMMLGAEKMIDEVKGINEGSGPVFHSRSDPRVTKTGRIIRKYSLDELPQLWNVFIGDMSLVGPRPPLFEEVRDYERWQRRRLSFRPGIVCLWQVMKRYQPNFDEWVKMDLEYIDNWSLKLDLKIIMLTIPAIFRGINYWKNV